MKHQSYLTLQGVTMTTTVSSLTKAFGWKVGSNPTKGLEVEHRSGGFSPTNSITIQKDGWSIFKNNRKVVLGVWSNEKIEILD